MRDSRVGESLWMEWDGEGLDQDTDLAYVTFDHVDVDIEVVRRALASCLQRDGVVDGLGGGFRMIDTGTVEELFAGYVDGARFLTVCDSEGVTAYGELVDDVRSITVVQF